MISFLVKSRSILPKHVKSFHFLNEMKHENRNNLNPIKGLSTSKYDDKRTFKAKEDLCNYIKRGNEIALNPSESLKKLDDLIKGFDESKTFTNILSLQEYKNVGYEEGNFFIVLTAPSMAGKTQIAFSVRSKRPLYFTFQYNLPISQNFKKLSVELGKAVKFDQERVIQNLLKNGFSRELGESKIITMELISTWLKTFKLKSLGFLVHLINDAESNFDVSGTNEWMEFLTRHEDGFHIYDYEPLSIFDIKTDHRILNVLHEKYFVFLDEFFVQIKQDPTEIKEYHDQEPENDKLVRGLVLLRNICRLLKVPCVLASTNSEVSNLVGQSVRTGSGNSSPAVWCYVLPKYSYLPASEVEKELNETVDIKLFYDLARKVSTREEERMKLLVNFILAQCALARPGVAYIAFTTLRNLLEESKDMNHATVDSIFTKFMINITKGIKTRKPDAFNSIMGLESNIRLLSGTCFDSKYDVMDDEAKHSMTINHHFFYLKNPRTSISNEEAFLLFPRVVFHDDESTLCRTTYHSDEYNPQCYFDEGEELLKLACLFGNDTYTARSILSDSFDKRSVKSIESPAVASSKCGDALENLAFASIIDSSHYCDSDKFLTFEGVPLENFLRNLLRNVGRTRESHYHQNTKLKIVNGIQEFISSIKVPCLYISNREWISNFKQVFDENESKFRLGSYKRTANKSEIDACFDLFDGNDNKALAVVECKNWTKAVGSIDYKEIILKAVSYSKTVKVENVIEALKAEYIKPELLEEFELLLKSLSIPKRKGQTKISALVELFQDEDNSNSIKSTIMNKFIAPENKTKIEEFFESELKNFNQSCPLIHFLFCNSFSKTRNLDLNFEGLQVNVFKFVKNAPNDYSLVKINKSQIHPNPSMIGIIIEADKM